jgi:hypothetical protein
LATHGVVRAIDITHEGRLRQLCFRRNASENQDKRLKRIIAKPPHWIESSRPIARRNRHCRIGWWTHKAAWRIGNSFKQFKRERSLRHARAKSYR